MTRINKLTQNPELLADDLFVIWDNDNQRTRSITAETLNKFTDANGANAQAFVNGYIQDGVLYMVRANEEVVNIGSIAGVDLLPEGSIPKVENGKLVASAVKETDNAVVFTKDIIAPQESVFVGPAVKISDKGGYLGVDNLADDRESTPVISFVYETEAERDAIFADGVSVPRYRYFVPAKWVYQFPFEAEYSNANKLSFEFQDGDNTLIRKFRMFSKKAQSGVRIWLENILPSGDAMVWENVTEDDFNEGKGQDFIAQGDTDQFTLVESGLVKISTANIRFRFNVQAQPGENLELQGQELDLGFGTGFYPRMVTYTQDEKDLDLLDSIETSKNRFGQFGQQFRIETSDIVARDLGSQAEAIPQGIFDTAITSDRPETTYVNGNKPIQINAITVKHIGTWSPVQVSLNDDRSQVVDLVDGDNTITFTKPLTVEANQSVYFRFTGAVGTGSQTQISLLGDAQQEIYYKLDITELDEKTVTVNGVESVVAGNKIFVDDSDPKNPIVSWDPSGDLLPGVNVNKDGVQVLSAADTLNFSGSFDITKAKDTGGTVNIELSTTARGTNEVGVFESTTDLLAEYPTPEDGLYARVLQGNNNLPDDRYESKGGSWIGMGGVAGQVVVDANKSLGLVMGDGLKSEDDGGNSKISLDGNTPVLTFDVTIDSTRSVDNTYVGKIINIIQTPPSISIPMQITLVDHSQFKTGDTIKIAADRDGDDAYKNYYFAVYFTDATGRQLVKYPANNITMVRTDTAWDVQLDGRFTNVSIRPKAAFNIPYAPDEQYNTPVNAFVFAESPAVEFQIDEDTNTRIVKLELDKIIPENPTVKSLKIEPDEAGYSFVSKSLDGTDLVKILTTDDESVLTYEKSIQEYEESVVANEVVTAGYVAAKCVLRDGGWIAGDLVVFPYSAYVMGYDAYFATENFYIQSNTKLLTGSATYVPGPGGGWDGEVTEFGRLLDDSIEFDKAHIKNLTVDGGNVVIKYKRADLDYVQMAYQGKFGDSRAYYPVKMNQDSNGWTQFEFTGDMVFKFKDKDTGTVADKVLQLSEGRVTHQKRPYYIDKKLVAEGDSPILGKLQTQRSSRPDVPPVSIYVDEYHNTIMETNNEFKLRHVDADGNSTQTVQTNVDRWNFLVQPKFNNKNLITQNDDASFNKVSVTGIRTDTAYNNFSIKGSSEGGDDGDGLIFKTYIRPNGEASRDYIQYFGGTGGSNQLANTESVKTEIAEDKAKGIWIGGVIKDTVNDEGNPTDQLDCGNPKHWVEFRKTSIDAERYLVRQRSGVTSSEIVIHLHIESGMTSCKFRVQTGAGQYQDKTIRVNEKWRFFLMQGVYPYFEKIDDGMASGGASSDFDGEGFGVPVWSDAGAGTIIQRQITGNYRNTSGELGDLIINLRTDNGVKNFRFYYSLPWNTLDSGRKLFAKVDEKAGQSKIIRPGEMWQCEVKAGQVFDSFFWTRIDDGTNTFVLEEELNAKLKIISSTIAEAQSPSFAKFINKSNVTVDYPLNADGEQYRPVNIEVMILDTDNLISDLNINVTSSDSYNGHYNSIGVIAIDSNGEWSTNSRRNGYRLDDGTNTYCVYSDSLNAWVLIVTNVDHNHVGSVTGGTPVNLYNDGQLPESYGIYTVDNNLDAIESEYFNKADVDVDYHTNSESNSYFTVNFGTAKPAGIVFYK